MVSLGDAPFCKPNEPPLDRIRCFSNLFSYRDAYLIGDPGDTDQCAKGFSSVLIWQSVNNKLNRDEPEVGLRFDPVLHAYICVT